MSLSGDNTACCAAGPPVDAHYQGRGTVVDLGNGLNVYVVGEGKRAILLAYDIFGFDIPQTRANCDALADAGFMVAMPDFFRGKPWDLANFPPKEGSAIGEWLAKDAPWDKVKLDIGAVVDHLRGKGAEAFGLVGFCWGGKVAMTSSHDLADTFKCVAAVHAAFVGAEDAEKAQVPVLLAPSGTDPSILPMKEALDKKPFAKSNVYRCFLDHVHGFAVARGDRSDPKVAQACKEVLVLLVDFFNANVTV